MTLVVSILVTIIKILLIVVPVLLAVAFLTLLERKVLSSIQRRRGPNVVGVFGSMQAFADGLKLFLKETIFPAKANLTLFLVAPIITFTLSLISWSVIPFGYGQVLSDINLGMLYLFAVSSLGVYGIIISGWASNSKYAFLGGLRSAAQMISYEVSIGLIIISVLFCAGSLNLTQIVLAQKQVWFVIPLFPMLFLFLISILAETNRPPFDLPEAEAELVSGYNVEYSATGFVLFFLGEYSNIILMSALTTVLFFGGWLSPMGLLPEIPQVFWMSIKIVLVSFFFVWIRATLPRYRYDQLMQLGWKALLPGSLGWVFFSSGILRGFDALI